MNEGVSEPIQSSFTRAHPLIRRDFKNLNYFPLILLRRKAVYSAPNIKADFTKRHEKW